MCDEAVQESATDKRAQRERTRQQSRRAQTISGPRAAGFGSSGMCRTSSSISTTAESGLGMSSFGAATSAGDDTHVLLPAGEYTLSFSSRGSMSPTEIDVESLSENDDTEPRRCMLRWTKLGMVIDIPSLEPEKPFEGGRPALEKPELDVGACVYPSFFATVVSAMR